MRQLILVIIFISLKTNLFAQPCNVPILGYAHRVYVIGNTNGYDMEKLMGTKISPMFFIIQLVKTEDALQNLKEQALVNKLPGSIFVFVRGNEVVRYCNQEEFAEALRNKLELKINNDIK